MPLNKNNQTIPNIFYWCIFSRWQHNHIVRFNKRMQKTTNRNWHKSDQNTIILFTERDSSLSILMSRILEGKQCDFNSIWVAITGTKTIKGDNKVFSEICTTWSRYWTHNDCAFKFTKNSLWDISLNRIKITTTHDMSIHSGTGTYTYI